jgi:low temperature requirement protein LtrA
MSSPAAAPAWSSRRSRVTASRPFTPLELFFDLALVFAVTQVTSLVVHDPTGAGVMRGMLVLAALWWAWSGYAC